MQHAVCIRNAVALENIQCVKCGIGIGNGFPAAVRRFQHYLCGRLCMLLTAIVALVNVQDAVNGLVHITALSDDYYEFDEENYELRGELTKKVYHLGQKVCVRVADADALKRTVDFTVVETATDKLHDSMEADEPAGI